MRRRDFLRLGAAVGIAAVVPIVAPAERAPLPAPTMGIDYAGQGAEMTAAFLAGLNCPFELKVIDKLMVREARGEDATTHSDDGSITWSCIGPAEWKLVPNSENMIVLDVSL